MDSSTPLILEIMKIVNKVKVPSWAQDRPNPVTSQLTQEQVKTIQSQMNTPTTKNQLKCTATQDLLTFPFK